jgi:hypothetical protein
MNGCLKFSGGLKQSRNLFHPKEEKMSMNDDECNFEILT